MIFMLLVTHKSEIRILCLMKPTIAKCFQICQLFLITFFFVAIIYLFINFLILSDCRRGTSHRNGHGQIYRYTKLWKRLIKEETKEALNNFCLM